MKRVLLFLALLGILLTSGCIEKGGTCPELEDSVLCGICNDMNPNNPRSGRCTYCEVGQICEDDVCGKYTCITPKINTTLFRVINGQPTVANATLTGSVIGYGYTDWIMITTEDGEPIEGYACSFEDPANVPDGLSLSPDCELSGMLTTAGDYVFGICATDEAGVKTCGDATLEVRMPGEPTATSTPSPTPTPVTGGRTLEKWEGTYKYHEIYITSWLNCITDTTAPVSICVTRDSQYARGVITFPTGFTDTVSSPNTDSLCAASPHCSAEDGSSGSEFTGQIDPSGKFNLNELVLDCGSYLTGPENEVRHASVTISGGSMEFNFDRETADTTITGSLTATKVADDCN